MEYKNWRRNLVFNMANETINGARILIECQQVTIEDIFGYPGGAVMPIYDWNL